MKKKILIFGAYGFLGRSISKELKKQYTIFRQGRKKSAQISLKFNSLSKVKKIIQKINPHCIINLIGSTSVNKCENKTYAYNSNIKPIKLIVDSLKSLKISSSKCYLLHISTDQVYNGDGPNKENKIKPINNYSLSKLKGEKHATKVHSLILRTNFFGKSLDSNTLVDWLYDSLKKNKIISGYYNILFSPLHVNTLSKIIIKILNQRKKGIFNVGSKNSISKYDFLKLVAKQLKLNTKKIVKRRYEKNIYLAKRPLNMSLNIKKFERVFKIKLPLVNREIKLLKNKGL